MSEVAAPSSCSDRVIRAGRSGKSPRAAASSVSSRRLGFHGCPRYRSGMEAVSKSGVAKRRLNDRVGPGGARTRGHPCPGGDRATLQAAVISCCVLPSAKARTCSPRVGEGRLPPAGFAAVVRPRCRAGAAAFVAVVAVLAETAFFCLPASAGRGRARTMSAASLPGTSELAASNCATEALRHAVGEDGATRRGQPSLSRN